MLLGISPELISTAEIFGVSARSVSGVVRGGPEARFHEGSTRVPPGFHQGSTSSTRVPRGSARAAGWCEHQKEHRMLLGISPELIGFLRGTRSKVIRKKGKPSFSPNELHRRSGIPMARRLRK